MVAPAALLRYPSLVTSAALRHPHASRSPADGWSFARRELADNKLTSLEPSLLDNLAALTYLYVMRWRPLPCCAPNACFCALRAALRPFSRRRSPGRRAGWAYARRGLHNNRLTSLPPGLFDSLTALLNLCVMRWHPQLCCAPSHRYLSAPGGSAPLLTHSPLPAD